MVFVLHARPCFLADPFFVFVKCTRARSLPVPTSIYIGWRHPSVWAPVCICVCMRRVCVCCGCWWAFCARELRCCCGVLIYVCVCLRVCACALPLLARVQGKLTFPNGMVYVGEFKDDNMHGQVRRVDALPLSAPHGALRAGFCDLPFFAFACSILRLHVLRGSTVAAVAVRGYTIRALWTRLVF